MSESAGRSSGKREPSVPDGELEREVRRRLHDDQLLQMHPFGVSVSDGSVTLIGQLPSAELRHRAASLAAGVRGVREVINRIVVAEEPA